MVGRTRLLPPQRFNRGTASQYLGSSFFGVFPGSGSVFDHGMAECTDVVDGTRTDHPLGIRKQQVVALEPCNGSSVGTTFFGCTLENYIPYHYAYGGGYSDHADFGLPGIGSMGATVLARTNPNRPAISLPLAIAELKDLPGLIKHVGEDLIRGKALKKEYHQSLGDAFLSGIYGWAPLISDMMKLLQFQDEVAKRAKELERLDSSGGLKRRITLASMSKDLDPTRIRVESDTWFTIDCDVKGTSVVKRWATVRWRPSAPMPSLMTGSDKYRSLARGTVLGLGAAFDQTIHGKSVKGGGYDFWSQASDLWNIMPWSWMVDWFSNTGDFLDAHRNSIPVTHGNVNIMEQTTTTTVFSRVPGQATWASGGGGVFRYETKKRSQVATATLTASLPFLSGRQLSILGALGLQRLRLRP